MRFDPHQVIDALLVRRLVTAQFPQWRDLPVSPVRNASWDNRLFRLGERMVVRLPSGAAYAVQVDKEQRWLPRLAPLLPLPIPAPLAMGEPGDGYLWKWSIYSWIEGDTPTPERIGDLHQFAGSLAQFLSALHGIDPTGGPPPGLHNFHRGGPLDTYDSETRQAIYALAGKVDGDAATRTWEAALATTWQGQPVWVHGDISASNLLVRGDRLCAVIDFGMLGIGDPACDLSIAWTLFSGKSREIFHAMLPLDPATWARGRGWALWKALVVAAGLTETNAREAARSWHVIEDVLGGRDWDG